MTTWVLLVGLPGTGKSTLARALAGPLHAAVLDKDRVRAALFPDRLTDYTAGQDDVCMRAMLLAAAYLTQQQPTPYIFFDGRTFSLRSQRDEVIQAAEASAAGWRILHVTCTEAVAEARLALGDPAHPAKNRNRALYDSIRKRFEPIQQQALVVDTTLGFDRQLHAILAFLNPGEQAPSLTG